MAIPLSMHRSLILQPYLKVTGGHRSDSGRALRLADSTVKELTVLTTLVTLNLSVAIICLVLAWGCWCLQRWQQRLQARLSRWEQRLSIGLPIAALGLTQGRYGLVRVQQRYALWQQRRLQLVQILRLMQQLRWLWQRF